MRHCIDLQGEAERVGSSLKKSLDEAPRETCLQEIKPVHHGTRGVCYCTHRLDAVLIHRAAPYHTVRYLPKRAAFTERERQQ